MNLNTESSRSESSDYMQPARFIKIKKSTNTTNSKNKIIQKNSKNKKASDELFDPSSLDGSELNEMVLKNMFK